jgi:hypothetical protein
MKQKNNIRMRVQGAEEPAADFAKRLEKDCDALAKELNAVTPPICVMTASSSGRMTATIQIITNVDDDREEAVFNGFELQMAYELYKDQPDYNPAAPLDGYNDWLIRLKRKDLNPEKSGKD